MNRIHKLIAILFMALSGYAQTTSVTVVGRTPIPDQPPSALLLPFRCDQSGAIYIRRGSAEATQNTAVLKLRADGTAKTLAAPAGARPIRYTVDFFVAADGRTYLMGPRDKEQGVFVESYGEDGSYVSTIQLGDIRGAERIAVFPNGNIFVTGLVPGTRDHPDATVPFNHIYDARGKLVRAIELPDDRVIAARAEAKDSGVYEEGIGNSAVRLGDVALGQDTNAYVYRHSQPATVTVVNAGGEVLRSFNTSRFTSHRMFFVAGQKLAIADITNRKDTVYLFDAIAGNPIGAFDVPEDVGGLPACFDGSAFTFVSGKDRKQLVLVRATYNAQ